MSATTPSTLPGTRPPYRPALDGLRAIAVTGVLIFHLNPQWLKGGWLGVDLFFVLSGFLITTLLIREQNRTGQINFPAFWLARMRRLLPALITTLFAVIAVGWFLTTEARRQAVAYDVLAALGYVANWRFIFGDESYFSTLSLPSPVRHTWSLSIEEQFYVGFPLIMGLLGWITTRRFVHTIVLATLALISATLMSLLYEPGTDPVRVYFGTDTRAFELLIGAIGAFVFRRQSFGGFKRFSWLIQILGCLGLAMVILGFIFVSEASPFPYYGGLVLLSIAGLGAILAAASSPDSIFGRVLGFGPLRWLGLISYPLYLWHWPVILFVDSQMLGLRGGYLAIAQAMISILLAWATYTLIEGPIRKRHGFLPRLPILNRVLILGTIPLLIFSTLNFGKSLPPGHDPLNVSGEAVLEIGDIEASVHRTAMILGNSIPNSLDKSVQSEQNPYLSLIANTFVGCDPIDGTKTVDGDVTLPTADCLAWREQWKDLVKEHDPDITIFFVSQTMVLDRLVDGEKFSFGSKEFNEHLRTELDKLKRDAQKAGSEHFAISNLACHNLFSFDNAELDRINDFKNVQRLNNLVSAWGEANDVLVIDTYSALCPGDQFSETVNGVPLYSDGFHFTDESGPIFWEWMAAQLIAHMEGVE